MGGRLGGGLVKVGLLGRELEGEVAGRVDDMCV